MYFNQLFTRAIGFIGLLALCGCQPKAAEFRFNSVELLKQERLTLPLGEHYDEDREHEIKAILRSLFGTPDQPRFPQEAIRDRQHQLESPSQSNLEIAAGPVRSDEVGESFGLYREHCANCHGLTGDGAGATAGFLDPYPRDFRHGKFKFKSTPLRQAPTHQDMVELLQNGIPGTAMPSFQRLPQRDLEAIIDYVRYLSIRGQLERFLIAELARIDDGPILNQPIPTSLDELTSEQLDGIADDAMQRIDVDVLESLVTRWINAEEKVTPVSFTPPPVAASHSEHSEWAQRGRTLYFGKGNCAECHGQTATGNVGTVYYDDWTSDWIKSAGVDLQNRSSYRDFLKAGALPPRAVRPRNLQLAVMRGGSRTEDIYRKIANGIEGTPMPSSAAALSEQEIWDLVAYVVSLADNKATQ